MKRESNRKARRASRHQRIRRRISGTPERPRMSIMISNRNIYVQFVDDLAGRTLAAVSTSKQEGNATVDKARALGLEAAGAARAAGVERVVVDRGGFKFHGRVKAVVEGAEAGGLVVRARPTVAVEAAQDEEAS